MEAESRHQIIPGIKLLYCFCLDIMNPAIEKSNCNIQINYCADVGSDLWRGYLSFSKINQLGNHNYTEADHDHDRGKGINVR